MLDFVAAPYKSSEGNPIDINKLGALPVKSEAVQNGNVKLSSSVQNGSVRLSSSVQNGSVKLSSYELPITDVHPADYNSLTEPMATSIGSAPVSQPSPSPVMPPSVPTPPKAPPSSNPQAPIPPSKPAPVHAESSPPPVPEAVPPPKAAPPPPPKSSGPHRPPPPAMPSSSKTRPPPLMKKSGNKIDDGADSHEAKTKLKPFFWDKVTANANQSMVWDHIVSGSFQ